MIAADGCCLPPAELVAAALEVPLACWACEGVGAAAAGWAGFCVQLPALTRWAELTGSMLPLAGQ